MTNTTANAIYTNADGTSEFVNLDETGCVYAIISQATEADLDALHAGEHADYRIASREIEVGDGDTYAMLQDRADDEREVYSSITDVYPQILDLLGDDVEDFDVDAIAQEITEWYDYLLPTGAIAAGSSGLRIRAEYADDVDALNAVLAKHCRTA